jgi:hypothetical protein
MLTRPLSLATIVCIGALNLLAQETEVVMPVRDFGIAVGWTGYQVRDHVLTPIRHDGKFPSLSVFHLKKMPYALREIHADFMFNPLTSRFEDEINSLAMNLSLNYRYLPRVFGESTELKVFAGPIIGSSAHLGYYNWWDEGHIYWLNSYFLGLNARFKYPTSGMSQLVLDLYMPLITLASRPPERFYYKELNPKFSWIVSRLHDDMALATLDRHLAVNAYLEYVIAFSKRYQQGVFWKASYVRSSLRSSENLYLMIHTLGTRLYF